jgi:hypothetical protein
MTEIESYGERLGTPKLPSDKYSYIEFDGAKWRFKGLRANIVDAVLGLKERSEDPTVMALDFDIPIAAVYEAIKFVESNPEVVSQHQRRMLKIANENSSR